MKKEWKTILTMLAFSLLLTMPVSAAAEEQQEMPSAEIEILSPEQSQGDRAEEELSYAEPETIEPEETQKEGWVKENEVWYYYREGVLVKDQWQKDPENQKWYYLDVDGKMLHGQWLWKDAAWYFLNDSGSMRTDWLQWDGKWYFMKKSGAMATEEWEVYGGKWYYLNGNGIMRTGWLQWDGRYYFMKENGDMATEEWQADGGKWYYLNGSGTMRTGWLQLGDKWYYLNAKGDMKTEWLELGDKWYYLNAKGDMRRGWLQWGGKWYFMKKSGAMNTGWLTDGGMWYYTFSSGVMATGWQTVDRQKYYLKSSGKMASGEWIEGCYMKKNGAMLTKENSSRGIKVAIDPGHQRRENRGKEPIGPGASVMKQKVTSGTEGVVTKLNEYELNLSVAMMLRDELIQRGYAVYMVRNTHDVNLSNVQRAQMAASSGSDMLLRIHANSDSSGSVYGALTIAPTGSNPYMSRALIEKSQKLSVTVLNEFCKAAGARNRDVMYVDNMTGINWSTIPVTIVEMGFMSNASEDRLLSDRSYQTKMVRGMANGIDAYLK